MALPAPRAGATVVVTGASSAIGVALARELARRGHGVTLVARRAGRLKGLAEELRARHGVEVDVLPVNLRTRDERDRLLAALADRDVSALCTHAGFVHHGPLARADAERELAMVAVNVAAVHHLTVALLPRLVARGEGAILNVSSLAAVQPVPRMATYAATKAFVQALSEAVHAELHGTGVSVTALQAGPVRTEPGGRAGPASVDAAEVARLAVDGMVRGDRTVVPTLKWKAAGLAGRLLPRALYLPLARRFG